MRKGRSLTCHAVLGFTIFMLLDILMQLFALRLHKLVAHFKSEFAMDEEWELPLVTRCKEGLGPGAGGGGVGGRVGGKFGKVFCGRSNGER